MKEGRADPGFGEGKISESTSGTLPEQLAIAYASHYPISPAVLGILEPLLGDFRQQQDGQRQPGPSSDASKEGPLLLLGCACRQMPHRQSSVMNEKVTGTEQSPFRAAFDP